MRKIDPHDFHRATRGTGREINRQIVLNLVREYQPISRAGLARRMEVARATITPLVSELIRERLLVEGATAPSARGRKPSLLYVRAHDRLAVAASVQLSETRLMLADLSGRALATETLPTPACPRDLVCALATRIRNMLDAHAGDGACEGVGVVVPGMVDRATGRLVHAPTLGWRDVDLRGALQQALDLPVHVERDVVAGALALMWMAEGARQREDSLAYVIFSDGVGAGLVVGGHVVRGHRDAAGEFGHIPLSLHGPVCPCGSRGCLEAYTSAAAVVARYLGRELDTREAYARVRESRLTVADVIARARAGDVAAVRALETTARYIGLGLAAIANALNPRRIVVGGEITAGWDLVGPVALRVLEERTLAQGAAATLVVPDPPAAQTALRGAAALVIAPVFAAPAVG